MYKQSSAILALFLGSSEAITLEKHHHHHHPRHYENVGVRFLDTEKFAEGYGIGESMATNITINGPAGQETYKFAQQNQGVRFLDNEKFIEGGYAVGESMGNNITINGPAGQETYKFAQNGNKFAEGFGDRESMEETIKTVGPEKFITTNYIQLEDPVSW